MNFQKRGLFVSSFMGRLGFLWGICLLQRKGMTKIIYLFLAREKEEVERDPFHALCFSGERI